MIPNYPEFKYCVAKDRKIYYGKCFDTEEQAKDFLKELKEFDMLNDLLAYLGRNPDGSKIE